jgi:anti-anti-sigma regulatory factor
MNTPPQARQEEDIKPRRSRTSQSPVNASSQPFIMHVERSGEWMSADELREAALAALLHGDDVTIDVDRIDHLDASALQILLALDSELKRRKQNIHIEKASPQLLKWFQFAGADDRFIISGQSCNE